MIDELNFVALEYIESIKRLQHKINILKLHRVVDRFDAYGRHTNYNFWTLYSSFQRHLGQFLIAINDQKGDIIKRNIPTITKELIDMSNLIDMLYDQAIKEAKGNEE